MDGSSVKRRAAQPAPVAGDCVLLVDDDAVARLLTSSALAERSWRVVEADSGVAAIAAFERHRPDVVVLDALMPGLDGFATCERLRRLPGGEHVPVLMLTGLDDETSISRAYEAGATDFFVKTTSQWTLLSERLRYLLRAARMREELAESQARLTEAQRIARLGSWEWDIARRRVKLSKECFAIAGLPQQQDGLADWFVWTRVLEDERPRIEALFRQASESGAALNFDCRIARPDGQSRTVHIEAEIERDERGNPVSVHGVAHDITDRKQAEDQIRQLANFDSLTSLPNRRYFRDQFEASLERARATGTHVALLFLDIDRFKDINDTLGHQMGDELLREVARRLHQAVREHDTVARAAGEAFPESAGYSPPQLGSAARSLAAGSAAAPPSCRGNSVARLGGDEFTILLTDLNEAAAAQRVAERLLETLRRPVRCGDHELIVTASIGLALFPQHGADVDTLLRKADVAMYAVKDAGRNGWQAFDDAMNTASAERWKLETGLHQAIERGELVLHYQPKVNVVTGEVVGVEALMRWSRDGRLIMPGEFIRIAEDTGLIVPITEWAIAEVCRQIVAWQRTGVRLVPVSINISSRHVQRANLVEPVHRALQDTRLPAGLLELELTETVLMHNLVAALPLLQSLKRLGVSISIDDFGTGYSSLAYLKRLPIDVLKIDGSFVRELETSSDSAAIVAAIIAMSKSLKMRVVAEGVETAGQVRRLFEQGCQVMQGWYFARAVDAEELLRVLIHDSGRREWQVTFEAGRAAAAEAAPPVHANGVHYGPLQAPAAGAEGCAPAGLPAAAGEAAPPRDGAAVAHQSAADNRDAPDGGAVPRDDHRDRARRWADRFIGRNLAGRSTP
jgi:PAS domain S-box-containing protein